MTEPAVVRDLSDPEHPFEDSHVRKKQAPISQARNPLARHPDDGFVLGDPYPLSPSLSRALRAIVLAVLPPPPAPRPTDIVDRIELHVRRFMAYMHPVAAFGFALTILILDLSPIFLCQHLKRMRSLDPERASELLDEMVHGRFSFMRTLVIAVRGLAMSAYFDQDEAHRAIDYEPLPFLRERIARRNELVKLGRKKSRGVA